MIGSIHFHQASDYWYYNRQTGGKYLHQSCYGKPDNYVYYQKRHKLKIEYYEYTRKLMGTTPVGLEERPFCQEGFMFTNGSGVCNYISFRTKTDWKIKSDFTTGLVVSQTPILEDVVQSAHWPAVTTPRMLGTLAHLGRLEYFCNRKVRDSWKRYPVIQ